MQTDNVAQTAQAAMCRTTIIAGADASSDRTKRLVALVKGFGHRGRFDLLTVLEPERLLDDRQLFNQVARDAALAIKLHSGEQIVVAVDGDPSALVRALTARPEFRTGVAISGFDLRRPDAPPPAPAQELAVTCMDFRQHDGDLPERLREAYGLSAAPAILATAGGAKELVDAHPRGRRTLQRLKARIRAGRTVRRIVLTCHTDCGAMGGDAAPDFCDGRGRPDPKLQLKILERYLRASAASFSAVLPGIRIDIGVVRLKEGRLDAVLPVRL